MLSDEEKQAIKYIKNILNYEKLYYHDGIETNFLRPVDKENVKTVLNIIEKQQKEIEELIEERLILFDTTVKNSIKINDKKWKDKIKAKIEELEKLQKEFPNNDEIRVKIIAYKELLKKE